MTENKLEISDLRRKEMVLSGSKKKGNDQLCSYCTADLWLCFHRQKSSFLTDHDSNENPFTKIQEEIKLHLITVNIKNIVIHCIQSNLKGVYTLVIYNVQCKLLRNILIYDKALVLFLCLQEGTVTNIRTKGEEVKSVFLNS